MMGEGMEIDFSVPLLRNLSLDFVKIQKSPKSGNRAYFVSVKMGQGMS